MFQSRIKVYDNPCEPPVLEIFNGTISEYITHRWPNGIPTSDFTVFRGQPSIATICSLDFPENWADSDGDFSITLQAPPAGALTPFIPYIVGAVVAVVAAFALAPAIPAVNTAGRAQQSPNNSLEKRSNEPRVNQRINDIFGDENCTYDLLSVPETEYVNNDEFETFYSIIGRGSYDVLTINDGDTPLETIDGAAASVYGPYTSPNSGHPPQLTIGGGVQEKVFTAERVNSVDGATLTPPNISKVDITSSLATASGVLTMPSSFTGDLATIYEPGDVVTLADCWFAETVPATSPQQYKLRGVSGTYTVISVTSNTLKVDITGHENWQYGPTLGVLKTVWSLSGTPAEESIVYTSNPGSALQYTYTAIMNNTSGMNVGPFVVTDTDVDMFRYNLIAINGLYRDDGTVYPITVDNQVTIEALDSSGIPTGQSTVVTITLQGSERNTVAITKDVTNPYKGFQTRHTMRRITDRPPTENQNVSDDIKWRDLYTRKDNNPSEFGDVTTVHIRLRATDSALRVKERTANSRVIRRIPQLGEGWDTSLSPLKDFASICSAIARDPRIGKLPKSQFDSEVWQLERDKLISYFGDSSLVEVAHTFDDTNITFEESIQLIASAAFCQAYRQGSSVRVLADLPQSVSSALFTHRNTHPGSYKRSRRFTTEKRRDGVQLTYKDRTTDAPETITLDVNDGGSPSSPSEVEIHGIRTKKQAVIHARRKLNRLKYQRITFEVDALSDGRLIVPTNRVDVVNNSLPGTMDGEVKNQDGLTLTVSQPVEMDTRAHSVVLRYADGSLEGIPVISASNKTLVLSRLPQEEIYTGNLKSRTIFNFGPDEDSSKMAMRIESVSPDSLDRTKLQGVNYTDGYFEGDLLPV